MSEDEQLNKQRSDSRVKRIAQAKTKPSFINKLDRTWLVEEKQIQRTMDDAKSCILSVVEAGTITSQVADRLSASLDLLQVDTVGELSLAMNLFEKGLTFTTIDSIVYPDKEVKNPSGRFTQQTKIQDLDDNQLRRATAFILISNIFNRGDELIETALKTAKVPKEELLPGVMTKGVGAMVSDSRGKARHSPEQILRDIGTFVVALDLISEDEFNKFVQTIIKSQYKGLKMIDKEYSIDEAVQYRVATLGMYHRLLARVSLGDGDASECYVQSSMRGQFMDDFGDVLEDMNTQPNPFIPLLKKYDLMSRYTEGIESTFRETITPSEYRPYDIGYQFRYLEQLGLSQEKVNEVKDKVLGAYTKSDPGVANQYLNA